VHVRDLFDLTGRTALVTGGGRGIGRHIAIGLAEAGADVFVASRKLANCEETVRAIERTGRRGTALAADLGRADDVIKSAGHLIGPFEVESALMEHKAVAEAGVIGKPDPMAGEIVKAFVALKPGFAPSEDLRRELLGHARRRLGAAVAPKEIDFRANLPKTRSGKIMRRLLRDVAEGRALGDVTTLADPSVVEKLKQKYEEA